MSTITVKRSPVQLLPDPMRLVTKPYIPTDRAVIEGESRVQKVITRVLALTEDETTEALDGLRTAFSSRHPDLDRVFLRSFDEIASHVPDANGLPTRRRLLVGAYFSHEYSIEGAALTNPSLAAHPDQEGVRSEWLRVVLTLRAIGEGHLSSIEFRTGLIGPDGNIALDPPSAPVIGERKSPAFDKKLFIEKLYEMGADGDLLDGALRHLGSQFTMTDLDVALAELGSHESFSTTVQHMIHSTHWVASSNYELTFPAESDLSQRVLYPKGPAESQGMEDARLVRFTEADGSVLYYATYTAFDGYNILPQLITTNDFETFRIATLNGRAASNKGMAIFPRPVGGRYAALARSDGESNFLMMSDDVRRWDETQLIQVPRRTWDLLQIGNAGAPIETEAGWLVVTHGVGPMRQYALGAILLDIDDPGQVIGDLHEPLLFPDEQEREGYVPNVVYSCGSLVHNGQLVIAYGASDVSTNFATVALDDVLAELTLR